ncbi:hypothetical protein D3C81_1464430 [compost metagenome]
MGDGWAQQGDQRLQHGLAFVVGHVPGAAGFEHHLPGHAGQGGLRFDAFGTRHADATGAALDLSARQNQRQLARTLVEVHVQRGTGVDQGQVAGPQFDAGVLVFDMRGAGHLQYGVVVVGATGANLPRAAEQVDVGHVDDAHGNLAYLALFELADEGCVELAGVEVAAGIVDLAQPGLEVIVANTGRGCHGGPRTVRRGTVRLGKLLDGCFKALKFT